MERKQAMKLLPKVIKKAQIEVRWKPDSEARHLLKRKLLGHLPENATLEDYRKIIRTILETNSAKIYLYWFGNNPYPTIVTILENDLWLVMFSFEAILETAYVIENPEIYLNSPGFEYVGLLDEVLI